MATVRKRVAALALAASLTIFGISLGVLPSQALAWNNCPYGLVNDPYPGECRRYADANGDGICDLSQSKPVASTTTTAAPPSTTTTTEKSPATATSLAAATTASGEPPTGDCPLGPCAGCGACLSIGSSVALASTDAADTSESSADGNLDGAGFTSGAVALAATGGSTTTSTTIPPSGGSGDGFEATAIASDTGGTGADQSSFSTHYNVSPIAIWFFLIYAASFILYKTKKMKVSTHRKIWNVLLLATFLITGIFGLILTIQLDYTLPFTVPFDLLFWHVEAGVAMTLISLFHVGWHFNYYRNLLRRSRRKVRVALAAEQARSVDDRQSAWEGRERRRAEREARRGQRQPRGPVPGPALAASRQSQTPRPYLPPRGRLELETD